MQNHDEKQPSSRGKYIEMNEGMSCITAVVVESTYNLAWPNYLDSWSIAYRDPRSISSQGLIRHAAALG